MPTVKHLSYAGITLPLVTTELQEWLASIHPQKFIDFDAWGFDNPNLDDLPTPSIPTPPQFKFSTLHWPTGAANPAWFHNVVTTDILDQIRAVVSDPSTPQDLVMYDGRSGKTITASMYMLPARPLNQLGHDDSDLWILTLTDQRFYWYWKRGTVSAKPSSWTNLYSIVSSILGTNVVPDTIDTDYATPSIKWIKYYPAGGVLLDSVASQINQRVVVQLDGTVTTVNYSTAKTDSDSYIQGNPHVISGGLLDTADIARYVPSSINVLFANNSLPSTPLAPHVVNKTLASLSITEYGASTGVSNHAEVFFADLPYTGANTTAVNNYATQAATDWYGWQLCNTDIVYPGTEPWVMTGWEDCVEWTMEVRDTEPFASTHIHRGPFKVMPTGDWLSGLTPTPPTEANCFGDCGWFVGMEETWCLYGTVIGAWGRCSGIDTTQESILRYATGSGKWISQEWDNNASAWVDKNFDYDTGSGPLRVWYDLTKDEVAGSINDIDLNTGCCGDNYVTFTGGVRASSGFCTGTVPDTPCSPNTFRIRVECSCCPIDGWGGEGFYCLDGGSGCPGTCVELLEANMCDTDIVICPGMGPYATLEECAAVCTEPPGPAYDCVDAVSIVVDTIYTGHIINDGTPATNGLRVNWWSFTAPSTDTFEINFLSGINNNNPCFACGQASIDFYDDCDDVTPTLCSGIFGDADGTVDNVGIQCSIALTMGQTVIIAFDSTATGFAGAVDYEYTFKVQIA